MKKYLLLTLLTVTLLFNAKQTLAHDINYSKIIEREWHTNDKQGIIMTGSFYFMKNGIVSIENKSHQISEIPYDKLSKDDQVYVQNRQAKINNLNKQILKNQQGKTETTLTVKKPQIFVLLAILLLLGTSIFLVRKNKQAKYLIPVFGVGIIFSIYSFSLKSSQASSPAVINSAFAPFVPNVHTFYDSTYFWVESKGIPTTHPMMVGISSTGWQRQVPIPQCYMGTNAWPIPLNPVMSSSPIPVDSIHFTRGAIAIAVNGVPIFNEHTNTGADALTAGQLDNYGGHCGRGDDYHYHVAPLHLYNYTAATLPIAYALDGFAVYGTKEADGSNMQSLDANHGHAYGGTYHYHGTSTYPYMIAKMAGQVTEDATHQLIPQAVARPVRAGQLPLNGALITACTPNATNNGYNLTYTYKNNTDSIVYSWDANGNYTFNYYTGATMDSTETKHSFVQCVVPATPTGIKNLNDFTTTSLFPNPSNDEIYINNPKQIQAIQLFTASGILISNEQINAIAQNKYLINISMLQAGIYFVKIIDQEHNSSVLKFVKE